MEWFLRLASAWAWPLVVVILGLSQRGAIKGFIEAHHVKSFERDKDKLKVVMADHFRDVKMQIAEARTETNSVPSPRQEPPSYWVPSVDIDALIESSRRLQDHLESYASMYVYAPEAPQPAIVIDRAWIDVHDQLYRLVMREAPPPFTYITGNDLLQRAKSESLLDGKLLDAVAGLLAIHNETVTAIMGWTPTREQAAEFVSNAAEVLRLMEPYLAARYKGNREP